MSQGYQQGTADRPSGGFHQTVHQYLEVRTEFTAVFCRASQCDEPPVVAHHKGGRHSVTFSQADSQQTAEPSASSSPPYYFVHAVPAGGGSFPSQLPLHFISGN